jgi:phosphatidylethanolamine/phosphatidyl-N-methylethanolamine N-methyltransferase
VIEKGLMPVVRPLGFRTDFAWSRYAAWAAAADTHGMEFVERRAIPPLGHFSLIRFRKAADAAGAGVTDKQQLSRVVPIRHVNTKLSSAGN